MASELEGNNKASGASADYQHWRFVVGDLDMLMLGLTLGCSWVKTCGFADHLE